METTTTMQVTKDNIDAESYYNCCRLSDVLGYWNPIGAIKQLNLSVTVEKDDCGNIVKVHQPD